MEITKSMFSKSNVKSNLSLKESAIINGILSVLVPVAVLLAGSSYIRTMTSYFKPSYSDLLFNSASLKVILISAITYMATSYILPGIIFIVNRLFSITDTTYAECASISCKAAVMPVLLCAIGSLFALLHFAIAAIVLIIAFYLYIFQIYEYSKEVITTGKVKGIFGISIAVLLNWTIAILLEGLLMYAMVRDFLENLFW